MQKSGYVNHNKEKRMNYKPLLTTIKDFSVNFAVASFAVSAFQFVWYGFISGLFFALIAVYISVKLGGE